MRPAEDDFHNDHLSLLSAADFNGQVINNDHWLYWGLASRLADDGTEYSFNVVEQTEFLDDTTFAPLRGGKTDPYLKRCSQIKIQSAEKLMYICRDQLGKWKLQTLYLMLRIYIIIFIDPLFCVFLYLFFVCYFYTHDR